MRAFLKKFSLVFTAGCIGGYINRLAVLIYLKLKLHEALDLEFVPEFSELFIYTGIVWGGIWGILFLIPFMRKSVWLRGLIYGVPPSLVMLFIVFPYWYGTEMMALDLGIMIIPAVFVFNFIWGIASAAWLWLIDAE